MRAVATHCTLRKLSLFDTQVTDRGMQDLSELPELRILLLGKSRVTAEGSAGLQRRIPELVLNEM